MESKGFVVTCMAVVVLTVVGVVIVDERRNALPIDDAGTLRIEVVSKGDHHIYFEKDRDGVRAERLIDERGTSVTTYLFHYVEQDKGYEIFRIPGDAPENPERMTDATMLPNGIEYYWHVGQTMARQHEKALFENE